MLVAPGRLVAHSTGPCASQRSPARRAWSSGLGQLPDRAGLLSRVACSTRKKQPAVLEEEHGVGRVVEEASASSNGLFTESFKSVLADALSRQGSSALLQGQEKVNDEYQLSGQEEVLKAAVMASKSTLLKLQLVKAEVEKAIAVETQQVERLLFALQKARSDAAYYRTVANMKDDGASSD